MDVRFEVYDWDNDGGHDLIGSITTSLMEILKDKPLVEDESFMLIVEKKDKKRGKEKKETGLLLISASRVHLPTFVDYISSGCEISLIASIDFTSANGDVRHSDGLHRLEEGKPTVYERIISSVGKVLVQYDSDKMIPAFGYGGITSEDGVVKHCFNLKVGDADPECDGVDGLIEAYRKRLGHVSLSGPALLEPVCIHHFFNILPFIQCTRSSFLFSFLR
jgi:hypothetical protein